MAARLKPYHDYKDSGLPWLGQIPAHWEARRNGRLFAERIETGYPDLPVLEVSLRTGVRVRDCLGLSDACRAPMVVTVGRQASDKPQGTKPRGATPVLVMMGADYGDFAVAGRLSGW